MEALVGHTGTLIGGELSTSQISVRSTVVSLTKSTAGPRIFGCAYARNVEVLVLA
jgi:hypothetical protein